MQTDILKNIKKMFNAFEKIDSHTIRTIKLGANISLLLLIAGMVLLIANRAVLNFDTYLEFVTLNIIKSSFTILAEIIIGGLLVDYVFNKSQS